MPVETIMKTVTSDEGRVTSSKPPLDDATLSELGFEWRENETVRVLICKPLEEAGFVNGFSTRHGGVSDFPTHSLNLAGFDEDSAENIYENRRRFLAAFDGEFKLATAWQVHGVGVKTVTTDDDIANSEDRFDALVSDRTAMLVGVKTADCVPILIGDTKTGSYAAVHSGWKGTAGKIALRAVKKLQSEYGSQPNDLVCAIGPCASGANYEIGQDVMDAFTAAFQGHKKYFTPTRPGHAFVDLRLTNEDLLAEAGVRPTNIFVAPFCTIERTDLFFSYRVEKKLYGKTGRLLSVIGRTK